MSAVSIYIRITDDKGKRHYERVKDRNPQMCGPKDNYALLFYRDGKQVWETVGQDLNEALRKQLVKRQELWSEPKPAPAKPARKTVADAVKLYLDEVKATKALKTVNGYTADLVRFTRCCLKQYVDKITVEDLQDFVQFLRSEGLSKRTVYNVFQGVNTFLRVNEIMLGGKILRKLAQEYEEKIVDVYTDEELRALFAACDEEQRLVFKFFLMSGCREGEVAHMEWRDLNFTDNTLHVQPKPEWNWKVKDREDRFLPMPADLMAELKARRSGAKGNDLVFPNRDGRPHGHFLRMLKTIVKEARLEGQWELHKFRRTFATMHSNANVPIRALQGWLGHSSLEVTQAYLKGQDAKSKAAQIAANTTFAAILYAPVMPGTEAVQ